LDRRYVTADVFTDRRFAGNPLGVVLDAAGLSTARMQAIANEFGYAETTFILPPADPSHAAHVRIFTPGTEVPFAGHPNVGTAVMLARQATRDGLRPPQRFVFEEAAGLVNVELLRDGEEVIGAELTAPEPLSRRDRATTEQAARCLSLSTDDIAIDRHGPQVCSVGLPFLIVELRTRDALRRATPDVRAIRDLMPLGGSDAIWLYTRDVPPDEAGVDVQARMFSPLDGTGEDPATGSGTAAAAGLWADLSPETDGELGYRVGQGVDMGRPSLLRPRVVKRAGAIASIHIAGRAVEVMRGTVAVDEPG
jgi:trans-2,3-dihydro-3-hydroxyanthranilate isomerase